MLNLFSGCNLSRQGKGWSFFGKNEFIKNYFSKRLAFLVWSKYALTTLKMTKIFCFQLGSIGLTVRHDSFFFLSAKLQTLTRSDSVAVSPVKTTVILSIVRNRLSRNREIHSNQYNIFGDSRESINIIVETVFNWHAEKSVELGPTRLIVYKTKSWGNGTMIPIAEMYVFSLHT